MGAATVLSPCRRTRDCVYTDSKSSFDLCRSGCRVAKLFRQEFELWLPVSRNPDCCWQARGCRNQPCPTLPARDRDQLPVPRGCNRGHQLSGEPRLDYPCSAAYLRVKTEFIPS